MASGVMTESSNDDHQKGGRGWRVRELERRYFSLLHGGSYLEPTLWPP
ncbi:MAG: hypothetical protein ACOX2O_01475 [Bdellovibrionota bacterium]